MVSKGAYVLARADVVALPIESVNTETVDLKLSRLSDRNILRAMQDGMLAQPLSYWMEENFSETMSDPL